MTKSISILFLLIYSFIYSQNITSNDNFTITIGKKNVILDDVKYKESMKQMMRDIMSMQLESRDLDSIQKLEFLNLSEDIWAALDHEIDNIEEEDFSNLKFLQRKVNQDLVQYFTVDNFAKKDYEIIDLEKGSFKLLQADSLTLIRTYNNYHFYDDKIIHVEEHKNNTKIINGFKCFEITIDYINFNDFRGNFDDDFIEYTSKFPNQMKLWVTDEIDLKYHPIVKFKTILDHYYPVEVQITSGFSPYAVDIYTLESIKK